MGPVLAATAWNTNADLIEDCARLGYIGIDDYTLDPTYGRGTWWKKWRPTQLVKHDLKLDLVDFRALPEDDNTYDVAAFDPPYVCVGGRETTGMPEFHERFGMNTTPKSPAGVQGNIDAGLAEMFRVVRPRGVVLVKCQDYIWSGKLWLGTHHTLSRALDLGFEAVDRLELVQARPRPQPRDRHSGELPAQQHARRNLSTLFVLRAPAKKTQASLFDLPPGRPVERVEVVGGVL